MSSFTRVKRLTEAEKRRFFFSRRQTPCSCATKITWVLSACFPQPQKQKAPIFIGAFIYQGGAVGMHSRHPWRSPCGWLRHAKRLSCRFGEQRVLISRPSPDSKAEGPDFHRGLLLLNMAVREGFEPSIRFHVYTLSRRAPSATRTPHHIVVSSLSRLNGALL